VAITEPAADPAVAGAMAKLHAPVTTIDLDGAPFSEAVDYLRERSGLSVYVNWRVLEEAGIDKNAPVSLKAKDIPCGQALHLLLDQTGGGGGALDYTIEGGTVVVTAADDMARHTRVRVYDVRDMVGDPDDRASEQEKNERLVQLIQETIAPGTWRATGGNIGSIGAFNGKLVVTHTEMCQQQVQSLLTELRGKGEGR